MSNPTLHLICNAHLDPVWQWRWEEGAAETLATFRTAVQLLREHDRLIFNHNEAVLYQWVQRYDPLLFREIQALVKEKRWFISGGWYLQPDVNMPGTESLIRHIIDGRRYFKEYFGAEPAVAYNFDSFGHSGGLPQILNLAGYKMYIHMRPESRDLQLPSDLYRWRGVNGSEIIGLRIAVGLYHTERDNIGQRLSQGVELALQLNRDVPVFWGLGNHGGGATREDLAKIDAYIQQEKRVNIVHSTTDRLYEALKDAARNAPLLEGDLQRVFTGCYTSLSRLKRQAQKSLARMVQTEALCAAAWWLNNQEYPEEPLEQAWRDHLFNDFHDILPGSCTEPAEQDALDLYGKAAEAMRRLRLGAAVALNCGNAKTVHLPVTVMNANPAVTRGPVELECMVDYRPPWKGVWHLRLFKPDGTEITCQEEQPEALLPFHDWRRKFCFYADLPAVGAANFYAELHEGKKEIAEAPPELFHKIDPESGLIASLEAGANRECLAGSLFQPLLIEDDGDSWGTDRWQYREIAGIFQQTGRRAQVIQKGPVRTITESVLIWGNSKIVFHTIAYSRWAVLEIWLRIYWFESRKRLKLSVPTVFKKSALQCEVPGGIITRPADGQEHVHGRWFLLNGEIAGKDTALAVVSSGQHGLDFKDGEVRLSVLRSAAYCHEQGFKIGDSPERKYMDQGVHEVRLLVTAGDAETVRRSVNGLADWLNAPPVAYAHLPMGFPDAAAPQQTNTGFNELLKIQPESIRLLACKRSQDEKALIVRLQETGSERTDALLQLNHPAINIKLFFNPLEIKTLRIEKSGRWQEVDLILEK